MHRDDRLAGPDPRLLLSGLRVTGLRVIMHGGIMPLRRWSGLIARAAAGQRSVCCERLVPAALHSQIPSPFQGHDND